MNPNADVVFLKEKTRAAELYILAQGVQALALNGIWLLPCVEAEPLSDGWSRDLLAVQKTCLLYFSQKAHGNVAIKQKWLSIAAAFRANAQLAV